MIQPFFQRITTASRSRELLVAALFVVGGALCWLRCRDEPALDFQINFLAAQRLWAGAPLYDLSLLLRIPFGGFIGMPTTALLMLPLVGLPQGVALVTWRCLMALCFGLALAAVMAATAPHRRSICLLVGLAFLCLASSVRESIALGQIDGVVALALCCCALAVRRERWVLAGGLAAVATLLKISPLVVLLFLVLRAGWRPIVAAAVVVVSAGAVTLLLDGLDNWLVFAQNVAPVLSAATPHLYNQSLPALLTRILSPPRTSILMAAPLGVARLLAPLMLVGGLCAVATWSRRRAVRVVDLACLALIALLAGPVSWYHYASWALIACVPLAEDAPRRPFALGFVLLSVPPLLFTPEVLASPLLRVWTGFTTLGLLVWLWLCFERVRAR